MRTRERAVAICAGLVVVMACSRRDDRATPDAEPQRSTAVSRASAEVAPPLMPSASASRAPPRAPEGMLLVAGGTFIMGADEGGEEDEHPAHAVTLPAFWLDRTEVTQAAYAACTRAGACRAPRADVLAYGGGVLKGPDLPVVGVAWEDARAYCAFVGKRLPREAEFERAVRGDDQRRFPWGNAPLTAERAVYQKSHSQPVGSLPAGRGPYGHDDLAGNVWEWMADYYDPYAYRRPGAARGEPGTCAAIRAAQDELREAGRRGFTGINPIPHDCERVLRGGGYNYHAEGLRSTNRIHHPGAWRMRMAGLRCARDLTVRRDYQP